MESGDKSFSALKHGRRRTAQGLCLLLKADGTGTVPATLGGRHRDCACYLGRTAQGLCLLLWGHQIAGASILVKDLVHRSPPFARRTVGQRRVARFADVPPVLGHGVGRHLGHVGGEVVAHILEVAEQVVAAVGQSPQVDRVVADVAGRIISGRRARRRRAGGRIRRVSPAEADNGTVTFHDFAFSKSRMALPCSPSSFHSQAEHGGDEHRQAQCDGEPGSQPAAFPLAEDDATRLLKRTSMIMWMAQLVSALLMRTWPRL